MRAHKILLAALIVLGAAANLRAEYIFLKDGNIIQGQIVSEDAAELVILKTDKKQVTVKRSDTMRVLYTEIYLGKIFIQLTNGKNIGCYMVDEDRESYTFRMELYSPEEFKYKRDQVLFIARGNPTGLEGTADTTSVELKWFPPYQPAKSYRIYIKAKDEKEFRLADETSSKNKKLSGLRSNTKYFVRVTAIDNTGDESLPSNEFIFTTKNIAPEPPVILSAKKTGKGILITWKEAKDPDGKITGYRAYKELNGKTEILTDTKKTEYTVADTIDFDRIYIASIDDYKDESPLAKVYISFKSFFGLSLEPAVIFPLGKLADISGIGYGGSLSLLYTNFMFDGIDLNGSAAFYYLTGKTGFKETESKSEGIILIPVMFGGGYSFKPVEYLNITPRFAAGGFIAYYNYSYFDIPSSTEKTVNDIEINPGLSLGLSGRYEFNNTIYFTAAADYSIFFENSGSFEFLTLSIGAGMWF